MKYKVSWFSDMIIFTYKRNCGLFICLLDCLEGIDDELYFNTLYVHTQETGILYNTIRSGSYFIIYTSIGLKVIFDEMCFNVLWGDSRLWVYRCYLELVKNSQFIVDLRTPSIGDEKLDVL